MYLVGLTGGIATGKTTVSEIFKEHGIPVIDSDLIARQVVEPGTAAWKELRAVFGESYFDAVGGQLQREKLGQLVFADADARSKLNRITHPAIRKHILRQILTCLFQGHGYAVLDAPLLFESGLHKMVQKVVVVSCSAEQQLSRLIERNKMEETDARNRIQSQMDLKEKMKRATFIIDNSRDVADSKRQTELVIDQLNKSWLPLVFRSSALAIFLLLCYSVGALFKV